MLVCHCRRVNEAQISTAVAAGAGTPARVARATSAGTGCGTCLTHLREVIERTLGPATLEPSLAG